MALSIAGQKSKRPRSSDLGHAEPKSGRVSWRDPSKRDKVVAVATAVLAIVLIEALGSAWVLTGTDINWFVAKTISGLTSLFITIAVAAWFLTRQSSEAHKQLEKLKNEEDERRAIAAIGMGATWDLDLHRIYARFANDLKQLIDYDRLTIASGRDDGQTEVVYVSGDIAVGPMPGSVLPRATPEPDGVFDAGSSGFISKLTVPFLAVKGTVTLRSSKQSAYGVEAARKLRLVLAHVTPGLTSALLYESSMRQLAERTALADVGRAASGALEIADIFPVIEQALSSLIQFDHAGVILADAEGKTGVIAYWSHGGLLGLNQGDSVELEPDGLNLDGAIVGVYPLVIRNSGDVTADAPTRAWLQVGLNFGGHRLGALMLSNPGNIGLSRGEHLLLEQVAFHVAPAIRNRELLQTERNLQVVLTSRNQELHDAQQTKDRFLSTVSHELRTPLAIMSGYVDLLRANGTGNLDEDQLDGLAVMQRNARRLGRLINDLLDISRIGASSFELTPKPFSATEMFRALELELRPTMDEKRQRYICSVPADAVWLHADRDRVEQLVTNILTNASKYSPDGACVDLRATVSGQELTVSVEDQGIGISDEDQARLFSAFLRVDSQATRAVPGTGLGLYIAKAIVEMHGGRISLHSRLGEGTAITFTLPCVISELAIQEAGGQADSEFRSRFHPDDETYGDQQAA